jgi:hypothetical protein
LCRAVLFAVTGAVLGLATTPSKQTRASHHTKGMLLMQIKGFDYMSQKGIAHSRKEWAILFEKVTQAHGRRRVEHGETFAHDAHGVLLFEAYANIQLTEEPDWLA